MSELLAFEVASPMSERAEQAIRAYIKQSRAVFEDLREIATQLAALLVLAAMEDRSACAEHPMFASALQRLDVAIDEASALQPAPLVAHHHRHLMRAVRLFRKTEEAMTGAGRLVGETAPVLALLKSAWQEMVHTSKALPGFHTVDLQQACCAAHVSARTSVIKF